MTERERIFVPRAQDLLQRLQVENLDTLQWTGHDNLLQTRSSLEGHFLPALLACLTTVTLRDMMPPPQVLVQADQGFQA